MLDQQFADLLSAYLRDIQEAKARHTHHDHIRHLFLRFVDKAFGPKSAEFELERGIHALHVRGFIDALYEGLIFEFKQDMESERETGKEELSRYINAQADPRKFFGILSDGLRFETYVVGPTGLILIDETDFGKSTPEEVQDWLDSYLFKTANVPPNAENVVRRFGHNSVVFNSSVQWLSELFEVVDNEPSVKVKFNEWKSLLAKVYGVPVGTAELFLRHTYLTYFARILVFSALSGRPPSGRDLPGIIDGRAFRRIGFPNLAEDDFFTWVLEPQTRDDVLRWIRGLSQHLVTYDLSMIDEDLLKQLYQELVDPETRHDLGEYYTPDWIAELLLREIKYSSEMSLLDPACGSGTFLFVAIRILREQGVTGSALVDSAFTQLVGVDVHPLAVSISKATFLLSLTNELKGTARHMPPIPIFMADSLLEPDPKKAGAPIQINVSKREAFLIPAEMARRGSILDQVVDRMYDLALKPDRANTLRRVFRDDLEQRGLGTFIPFWMHNFDLLRTLIGSRRDTVWPFVLKNAYKPVFLAERKFAVIVGNPPWLIYRFIEDEGYQKEIKALTLKYGLLRGRDVKVFNEMETATVFFVHCARRYLRPGGTIAFVMPKSTLTDAKQHHEFQQQAFTKLLDFEHVAPIFNVPAAVIIRKDDQLQRPIPMTTFRGLLPRKNATLREALEALSKEEEEFEPSAVAVPQSPYYKLLKTGASIYPRLMWFVRPSVATGVSVLNPDLPYLESDPALEVLGHKRWKGIRIEGEVESRYLYGTLLSSHLLPFGFRKLNLVLLPLVPGEAGGTNRLLDTRSATSRGNTGLAGWLREVEREWTRRKKKVESKRIQSVYDRLDYEGLLTGQSTHGIYKLIYNQSGTHIAACVISLPTRNIPRIDRLPVSGIVTDLTTVSFETHDRMEAHYLAAVLNAPSVNEAIKRYQPVGLMGPRHITRRPFEHLPIPRYDPANLIHKRLAELSILCHRRVADLKISPQTSIGKSRGEVRRLLRDELGEIDELVKSMFDVRNAKRPSATRRTPRRDSLFGDLGDR